MQQENTGQDEKYSEYENERGDFLRSNRARKTIRENKSPLYIMTLDRKVYECISVNDDGTIEIGKQITPEEVAIGRAGLPPEKRKEIGEKLLEKKIFKKQETMNEAKEIINSL